MHTTKHNTGIIEQTDNKLIILCIMHNCLEILTVVLSFIIVSVIMSQTSMMFAVLDMRRHLTVVLVLFLESAYNQISSTK
jgi:hypothetical protein